MMKKMMLTLIVVLSVGVFGTVSSAHAFIDPLSLSVILGTTMIVLVTGAEVHYGNGEKKAQTAEIAVKKQDPADKERRADAAGPEK